MTAVHGNRPPLRVDSHFLPYRKNTVVDSSVFHGKINFFLNASREDANAYGSTSLWEFLAGGEGRELNFPGTLLLRLRKQMISMRATRGKDKRNVPTAITALF